METQICGRLWGATNTPQPCEECLTHSAQWSFDHTTTSIISIFIPFSSRVHSI